jgi:hypothetical protein
LLRARPRSSNKSIRAALRRLRSLDGRVVRVRFMPALTADRRHLYSNRPHGDPVFAGSFIRKREIILDQELAHQPRELARILVHEVFHFAWVRLGNPARRSYEDLLRGEWKQRARGELGWSAELRKNTFAHPPASHSERWREYLCESFCDTAAWLYSGVRRHPEYTLAARHRTRRADWFRDAFAGGVIPI